MRANFLGKTNGVEIWLKQASRWRPWLQPAPDAPLRAELFSAEQLAHHGKFLAEQHQVMVGEGRNPLLSRLRENEELLQAFNRATLSVDRSRRVTPAAEWLLDNFYLIEEQIQMARRHLPRNYSRELPRLTNGTSAGLPRVYDLVLELISHVDAQIDVAQLLAFIGAYQTVTPLNLGELWAVPIMLRLGLIENLRRITDHLVENRDDRDLADEWADRLQHAAETDPSTVIAIVADMARAKPPMTSAFTAEFCQRLARLDPVINLARHWQEQRLKERGFSIEQLLLQESQSQAADQVSVSHTIASLRFIGATDWEDVVERLSTVEQTLRNDPANIYGTMDFATRDNYRHAVEQIARGSRLSENDVAWSAIELAEHSARENGPGDRTGHVGYYLVDKGRPILENAARIQWPGHHWTERTIRKYPMTFYVGGIVGVTIPATLVLIWHAHWLGIEDGRLFALGILLLLSLSQLGVALMNWASAQLVGPRRLPRLDFSKGIPPDCRTIVVVPTMLSNAATIDRLLETIEIHYLANRDANLYFALLTDFADASAEHLPDDDSLTKQAAAGIDLLNRKYQSDRPNIFFLFHRPRLWNPAEQKWMGYERKRGKLTEFNALLRGRDREKFSVVVGNLSLLAGIRFVITLDTDTQLPRDAARRLAGAIAHPLNRPQFDPQKGIVCEGYGILQPRVGVSLPSAGRSWFARIFAGDAGIDPYTRMVSDIYQDIFSEGSFIGKGIYDVDAFEQAVHGRFPENTILSHDLIESLHARSALVSDIELFEEHPSRYNSDSHRRHRWIRGDWQIAQWLLPRIPGPDACNIANPLSGLSQWKIFDNLRRSLVPTALTLLLLGSWMLWPQLSDLGPRVVLAIILIPALLSIFGDALHKPAEWPVLLHLNTISGAAARQLGQIFLTLVFLPYDAYVSLDAIVRTWVRLLFTRRQMLEWQTSIDTERNARTDLRSYYRTMWIAPALALATLVFLAFKLPAEIPGAIAILLLWSAAPAIAWWISQPITRASPQLSDRQFTFLRLTARKTWRFFEHFVNARENWLPPDNFQEIPAAVIATRTSPTNIGLGLLANLSAFDFGWQPAGRMLERAQQTLATMQRLDRHLGHFYNWYDTRTLLPLAPAYISSVDSGNLAGALFTLAGGFAELAEQPILNPQLFPGLRDTLGVLRELKPDARLDELDRMLATPPVKLRAALDLLQSVVQKSAEISRNSDGKTGEIHWWMAAFQQGGRAHLDELLHLAPWLRLPTLAGGDAETTPARDLAAKLEDAPTFNDAVEAQKAIEPLRAQITIPTAALNEWFDALAAGSRNASARIQLAETLRAQATALTNMDASFLYDTERELFTIGYNVAEHRRDASFYDLLASESRLGSYVAIAQGLVPQQHWFSLGRLLAATHGDPVLVSWSGSMFEYLMPRLLMPAYENTLLDQTCRAAVKAQIEYGKTRGTPWGISESGYNLTDADRNYQYRAFGVPGLGFKRGLADDLVIAPYASVLALMVAPLEACQNLERLAAEGRTGDFGFYEAVDYTPSRLPPNAASVTIRSFMAHHEGMSLLALEWLLLDRPMQRRFISHPPFKAEELLLQERIPRALTTLTAEDVDTAESRGLLTSGEGVMRILTTPQTPWPELHLLSNGRYHVMVTNSGGGYSRWRDLAVTRWREDSTRDAYGKFCYLRDVDSGETWSVGYQPTLRLGKRYEAIFTQARAEFRQRQGSLEIHAELSVSPEDDVELQRLNLTNHGNTPLTIELTTYAEIVLAPQNADLAHPAFSNLFVQTEFLHPHSALLCTRRPRSPGENPPWLFHLVTHAGLAEGEVSCETDRAKFVGRGKSLESPAALASAAPLSNTTGAVLDPIVSLRHTVTIAPHETAQIHLVMGVAETRDAAVALVEKYRNERMADRLFDLAWTHSQVSLRLLDATEADAQLYARMAGALIYARPTHRASQAVLLNNRRGQSGLWSYGISGDLPVVLLRMASAEKMELVRRLIQAHAYWRMKGLAVEMLILNEDTSVYRQSLHDTIAGMVASSLESQLLDKPGGIFVRRIEQIPAEDRILLLSVARLVLSDENGTLEEQFQKRNSGETEVPELEPTRSPAAEPALPAPERELMFFNGLGGFAADGREYVITLPAEHAGPPQRKSSSLLKFSPWRPERSESRSPRSRFTGNLKAADSAEVRHDEPLVMTPAPWVNVIANPHFGTLISESGGAYSWFENSHEFRLTPWNNDPVSDISGEAFYIRDEETGKFWSPTPLPARGETPYAIRHGFGYSVFEHTEDGIASEMWVYVAGDAPVKFNLLKLRNVSGRPRRLAVYGYWEWVLADVRAKSLLHVQTELDAKTGALLARNPYHTEFSECVAFVDVGESRSSWTGDRRDFLGRNGTPARPAALGQTHLSGRTGAGLDPCAALQVMVDLPDQREKQVCFRLGAGRNLREAQDLVRRYKISLNQSMALDEVRDYWRRTLGNVQVETPDVATNLMANGWLLYQTLGARLRGRTGFYQSGGAFGFRDQLQDAMALVHTKPELLREQLLRAAAHQFREGDVQHWWHPPSDRGVRTRFSDDFLWLPYATCRYVKCLNDTGVLDERITFLEARALREGEESFYDLPLRSAETGTLYEHCVRAIENGLKFGAHGLPLIGCGDWNDGMNLVGEHGRGESVWLAFFLFEVLTEFAELARQRKDTARVTRFQEQAELLRQNIEANAWDGQWYRRAYFDNGEPLGSQANAECQIDSLPQSWAVLTGLGDPDRARLAMASVDQRLVHRDAGLIQLFAPPFDKSPLNPGYIKGYLPGVRENGGQYTHAAIWVVMAFMKLGEDERAWKLFNLLNPVNHGKTAEQIAIYKVEPYVVAADVYAVSPHVGRGGWTWYTGSAAWMYRLVVESMLGLRLEGERLFVEPHVPGHWRSYKIQYRYRDTIYHLLIQRTLTVLDEPVRIFEHQQLAPGNAILLKDDRQVHHVEIQIGLAVAAPEKLSTAEYAAQ